MTDAQDITHQKQTLRQRAYRQRNDVTDPDQRSREAVAHLLALEIYREATTVLWYVDCRSELRTQWALPQLIASGQRVVVPYCTRDAQGTPTLGLWQLQLVQELVVGQWKILAPPPERWEEDERRVKVRELDAIVVPGVAFTRHGVRLGNGQGYYDRLLQNVSSPCACIGLCYEAQLWDSLPSEPHDAIMDYVVTEKCVYPGQQGA